MSSPVADAMTNAEWDKERSEEACSSSWRDQVAVLLPAAWRQREQGS